MGKLVDTVVIVEKPVGLCVFDGIKENLVV